MRGRFRTGVVFYLHLHAGLHGLCVVELAACNDTYGFVPTAITGHNW